METSELTLFSVISDIACDGLTRARMSIVNERQRYFYVWG